MPVKPGRGCRAQNCPRSAEIGGYCAEHAKHARKSNGGENRPSSAKRGYGRAWQKLRAMKLKRFPLCEDPFGIHAGGGRGGAAEVVMAAEVDHIVPLAQGGENKMANLQALCKSCHSKKTRNDQAKYSSLPSYAGGKGA